jgi:TolB-like protein
MIDFRPSHDRQNPKVEQKAQSGPDASVPSTVRFGVFELDLRAAELRKNGHKIRLQEQPFQILVELLACPGEVVLREEIRRKLWPNNTVVEFEHSINAAVKRLRDSLQDSAENPRYIETLARRGYRFIAPVSREPEKPSQQGVAPFAPAAASSLAGATWGRPEQRASVAVLPFANTSGEPENEYFSDGLAEEIINELAHVPGLKVIARTSAFAFKGKQDDIRVIASALGVANIVEGSVRRAGTRVRVTAELIAAIDGCHLWSERYDREMADIFAVQGEIAQAVATALRVHLTGTSRQYIPQLPAYEAYLKARHCMAAFTRESLPRSRDFYEQAIALDAGFALAHSGLAMALVSLVLPGITAAHSAMPLARSAAKTTLDLDPTSQEAHAVLGMVAALYDYDYNEAERRFRLAMAREPIPAYVRWYYSFSYLLPMGRTGESVRQCMCGMQDDPLNFMGGFHYAGGLLAGGKAEAGEAQLRQLSELYPSLYQPYYLLSLSQAVRGLHKEALTAAERACSLAPWSTTTRGLLGGILRSTGEVNRASELRDGLLTEDQYGTPMGLLLFHVGCSEMRQAADWAARAIEQRDTKMILFTGLVRAYLSKMLLLDTGWSDIARTLGIAPAILAD